MYIKKNTSSTNSSAILKAFTLVELIVVIVILAILATIAFLSFSSYSSSARDSTRLSDLRSITKALETQVVTSGVYPDPSNGKSVTFKGSELWSQGTFGESTRRVASAVNKVPKDPLYGVEYSYTLSKAGYKKEYLLSAIMEKSSNFAFDLNPISIETVNAEDTIYQSMVIGNFNGMVARVFTGGVYYVLAMPSIITSTPSLPILDGTGVYLVRDKDNNVSDAYLNMILTTTGGTQFIPRVIYSGSTMNLTQTQMIDMTKNLYAAFSGTAFTSMPGISNLMTISPTDGTGMLAFGNDVLNQYIGSIVSLQQVLNPNLPPVVLGSSGSSSTPMPPSNLLYWVTSSADGSRLAGAPYPGYIYTSNDAGLTWTGRTTSGNRNWNWISSSADGSRLVGVVFGGGIYKSSDYGVTWVQACGGITGNFWTVDISADGNYIAFGAYTNVNGYNDILYTSSDFGVNCLARKTYGHWTQIKVSQNGQNMLAGNKTDGVYFSGDYGVTWTKKTPIVQGYAGVSMSDDGKYMQAIKVYSPNLEVSSDYGATWTQKTLGAVSLNWMDTSADGKNAAIIGDNANLWVTNDYGVSWSIADATPRRWMGVEVTPDGRKAIAADIAGYVRIIQ